MPEFKIMTCGSVPELWDFIRNLGPRTIRQFDNFEGVHDYEVFVRRLDDRHNFLGMLDDELIAYAFLQKYTKKQNVVSLGVVMADKYHGHGYGKPLYKHVTDWALERYTKIWSAVYEDNDAVLHIHKSLGYIIEGVFMNELNDGRCIYSLAKHRDDTKLVKKLMELQKKWDKI